MIISSSSNFVGSVSPSPSNISTKLNYMSSISTANPGVNYMSPVSVANQGINYMLSVSAANPGMNYMSSVSTANQLVSRTSNTTPLNHILTSTHNSNLQANQCHNSSTLRESSQNQQANFPLRQQTRMTTFPVQHFNPNPSMSYGLINNPLSDNTIITTAISTGHQAAQNTPVASSMSTIFSPLLSNTSRIEINQQSVRSFQPKHSSVSVSRENSSNTGNLARFSTSPVEVFTSISQSEQETQFSSSLANTALFDNNNRTGVTHDDTPDSSQNECLPITQNET